MEAPADPEEDAAEDRSRSNILSTPYFKEFCSARSLRKASSFKPVMPSEGGRGGSGTEIELRIREAESMMAFV